MANPNTAHEPSMEEILASIRQIISEDGDAPAVPSSFAAQDPSTNEASEPDDPEPVDVPAQRAPALGADQASPMDAAPVAPPSPQPQRQAAPPAPPEGSGRRLGEATFGDAAPAPTRPAEPPRVEARDTGWSAASQQSPAAPVSGKPLLSAGSDAAVSGSFSALAHTILAQNARTLEDLVSEMLRPMLQGWLDENLPGLVERLVKEEIDRVSRGRR